MNGETNDWQRIQRRRLTRRGLLRTAALGGAGLAAAAVVGCGDDDEAPAATTPAATTPAATGTPAVSWPLPPAGYSDAARDLLTNYHWSKIGPQAQVLGTPRMGGTFILPGPGFGTPTLHPDDPTTTSGQWLFGWTHSGLVSMDFGHTNNTDLLPATNRYAVSESWEQRDASTYIFKLRNGVTWQDIAPANGDPLSVDDISATYDLFKNSVFHGQHFKDISSIEETEPGVVKISTSEPNAQLLRFFLMPSYALLNAKHIEEGDDSLNNKAIGTGAFTQGNFVPETMRVYKRNPNWWWPKDQFGNQLPYMDGIAHQIIRDPAAHLAAFRTGGADYFRVFSVEQFNQLQGDMDVWAEAVISWFSNHITPSHRDPVFQNVAARRALSLAINTQSIIDNTFGGAATVGTFIPWYFRGRAWPETVEELGQWHKYDPEGAKNLLSAANIQTPVTVDFYFGGEVSPGTGVPTDPYAESVQRDLQAIGIEAKFKPLDRTANRTTYFGGEWTGLYVRNQTIVAFDADRWLQQAVTDSGLNGTGVSDSRVDELFRKERATVDPDERAQVFQEIEDYVTKDQLLLGPPLPNLVSMSVWQKYIHNLIDSTNGWINGQTGQQYPHVWLDEGVSSSRDIDSF